MASAVILEFARAEHAGDPFGFRFAAQEYLLRSEGGAFASAVFPWTKQLLDDLDAMRRSGCDPALTQRLGETLRTFLEPLGWAQYEDQICAAARASQRVFVTIRSAAAELYALPWELLTLRATGQHLGELPTVLLRYEWPDTSTVAAVPRTQPGRFLLAWSAAGGAVPIAPQLQALRSACQESGLRFHPESDVLAHASSGRLSAALASAKASGTAISVLHLLCHGGAVGSTFGVLLEPEEAGSDPVVVDAGRLRQLLAPYADTLRLVVLSACDTGNPGSLGNQLGSLAQTLHRAGFASVLASRYPLSVAGSIRLCEALYPQLLVQTTSLEDAVLSARRRLAEDASLVDWASLQLYSRAHDGNDTRPVTFRPYRGLLAFQPEHQRFLFGRDGEVAEILSDLAALTETGQPRMLIIAGVSGTGKSSLVLGGAVPALQRAQGGALRLARMRPGSQPLQALAQALDSPPSDDRPVLLVVDQFEEVFTHVQEPALRQSFVRRLWALASAMEASRRVTVLVTLRVDFIGRCGELVLDDAGLCLDRVAYDEAHRIFVSKLGPAQLRAVITEPARLVGLELEAGLENRILHDLGHEPGALPLLQDTLDLLWQRRQGRLLTQQAYDEIGGVIGALQGHADALYDALSDAEQLMVRRLMVRLVEQRHEQDLTLATRRRVPLRKLRPSSKQDSERLDALILRLVDARLLVADQEGPEPMIEVAHEALIRSWTRLHGWLKEEQLRLAALTEFDGWVQRRQTYGTLLVGSELVHAEAVARLCEDALGTDASALLTASRRRRRNSRLATGFALGLGCIILLLLGLVFTPALSNDDEKILLIFVVVAILPITAVILFVFLLFRVLRAFWRRRRAGRSRGSG